MAKDTRSLPRIRIEKLLPKFSTPLATQRGFTNVIIGISSGRKITVTNEAVTRGATLYDALDNNPISSITKVGDSKNVTDYLNGTDYQVSSDSET